MIRKFLSLFLLFSLTISSWDLPLYAQSFQSGGVRASVTSLTSAALRAFSVPPELGSVQSVFRGSGERLVFHIQDAHAVPEAQKSIQGIIDWLSREKGVSLAALEGAEGELDPAFFRAFPDKKRLKELFQNYLETSELSGAAVQSVLGESTSRFVGVEDWKLYEEEILAFHRALENKPVLETKLAKRRSKLQDLKEKYYSPQALELDEKIRNFESDERKLSDLLRFLQTKMGTVPKKYSHLAVLTAALRFQSRGRGGSRTAPTALDREIRRLAERVGATFMAPSKEWNRKRQAWNTGEIRTGEYARFLMGSDPKGSDPFKIPISPRLVRLIQTEERLSALQGPAFFKELSAFIKDLKAPLLRSEQEREIDREDRRCRLLQKLVRFELTFEEWQEMKGWDSNVGADPRVRPFAVDGDLSNGPRDTHGPTHGSAPTVKTDLSDHFTFYDIAQRRSEILLGNALKTMDQTGQKAALLITGGFHSEEILKGLREKNISYVQILPAMREIPKGSRYLDLMQGKVSWEKYFEVRKGRINLYDAFLRGARDKLLEREKGRKGERARSSPIHPFAGSPILKQWRGEILRTLAAQNRLDQAQEYLRFLDEPLKSEWSFKLENFISQLRRLHQQNQLNEANLMKLLQTGATQFFTANASLVSRASLSSRTFARSEVRSKNRFDRWHPEALIDEARRVMGPAVRQYAEAKEMLMQARLTLPDENIPAFIAAAVELVTHLRREGKYDDVVSVLGDIHWIDEGRVQYIDLHDIFAGNEPARILLADALAHIGWTEKALEVLNEGGDEFVRYYLTSSHPGGLWNHPFEPLEIYSRILGLNRKTMEKALALILINKERREEDKFIPNLRLPLRTSGWIQLVAAKNLDDEARPRAALKMFGKWRGERQFMVRQVFLKDPRLAVRTAVTISKLMDHMDEYQMAMEQLVPWLEREKELEIYERVLLRAAAAKVFQNYLIQMRDNPDPELLARIGRVLGKQTGEPPAPWEFVGTLEPDGFKLLLGFSEYLEVYAVAAETLYRAGYLRVSREVADSAPQKFPFNWRALKLSHDPVKDRIVGDQIGHLTSLIEDGLNGAPEGRVWDVALDVALRLWRLNPHAGDLTPVFARLGQKDLRHKNLRTLIGILRGRVEGRSEARIALKEDVSLGTTAQAVTAGDPAVEELAKIFKMEGQAGRIAASVTEAYEVPEDHSRVLILEPDAVLDASERIRVKLKEEEKPWRLVFAVSPEFSFFSAIGSKGGIPGSVYGVRAMDILQAKDNENYEKNKERGFPYIPAKAAASRYIHYGLDGAHSVMALAPKANKNAALRKLTRALTESGILGWHLAAAPGKNMKDENMDLIFETYRRTLQDGLGSEAGGRRLSADRMERMKTLIPAVGLSEKNGGIRKKRWYELIKGIGPAALLTGMARHLYLREFLGLKEGEKPRVGILGFGSQGMSLVRSLWQEHSENNVVFNALANQSTVLSFSPEMSQQVLVKVRDRFRNREKNSLNLSGGRRLQVRREEPADENIVEAFKDSHILVLFTGPYGFTKETAQKLLEQKTSPKIIVEGNPVAADPEAVAFLEGRGILYLPLDLANLSTGYGNRHDLTHTFLGANARYHDEFQVFDGIADRTLANLWIMVEAWIEDPSVTFSERMRRINEKFTSEIEGFTRDIFESLAPSLQNERDPKDLQTLDYVDRLLGKYPLDEARRERLMSLVQKIKSRLRLGLPPIAAVKIAIYEQVYGEMVSKTGAWTDPKESREKKIERLLHHLENLGETPERKMERRVAVYELAQMDFEGVPAELMEKIIVVLNRVLHNDSYYRSQGGAAKALGKIGSREIIPGLLEVLTHPDTSDRVRKWIGSWAFQRLSSADEKTRKKFIAYAIKPHLIQIGVSNFGIQETKKERGESNNPMTPGLFSKEYYKIGQAGYRLGILMRYLEGREDVGRRHLERALENLHYSKAGDGSPTPEALEMLGAVHRELAEMYLESRGPVNKAKRAQYFETARRDFLELLLNPAAYAYKERALQILFQLKEFDPEVSRIYAGDLDSLLDEVRNGTSKAEPKSFEIQTFQRQWRDKELKTREQDVFNLYEKKYRSAFLADPTYSIHQEIYFFLAVLAAAGVYYDQPDLRGQIVEVLAQDRIGGILRTSPSKPIEGIEKAQEVVHRLRDMLRSASRRSELRPLLPWILGLPEKTPLDHRVLRGFVNQVATQGIDQVRSELRKAFEKAWESRASRAVNRNPEDEAKYEAFLDRTVPILPVKLAFAIPYPHDRAVQKWVLRMVRRVKERGSVRRRTDPSFGGEGRPQAVIGILTEGDQRDLEFLDKIGSLAQKGRVEILELRRGTPEFASNLNRFLNQNPNAFLISDQAPLRALSEARRLQWVDTGRLSFREAFPLAARLIVSASAVPEITAGFLKSLPEQFHPGMLDYRDGHLVVGELAGTLVLRAETRKQVSSSA